jgi:hypothetical protein
LYSIELSFLWFLLCSSLYWNVAWWY